MAGYRRFVAYVYEYLKGKKGTNCGFIKVEVREQRCRLELHLQCPGISGQAECKVYGFVRNGGLMDGYLLGSCKTGVGTAQCMIETDALDMNESGIGLGRMGGLILETEGGAFFGTEWDDIPIRPENFREVRRNVEKAPAARMPEKEQNMMQEEDSVEEKEITNEMEEVQEEEKLHEEEQQKEEKLHEEEQQKEEKLQKEDGIERAGKVQEKDMVHEANEEEEMHGEKVVQGPELASQSVAGEGSIAEADILLQPETDLERDSFPKEMMMPEGMTMPNEMEEKEVRGEEIDAADPEEDRDWEETDEREMLAEPMRDGRMRPQPMPPGDPNNQRPQPMPPGGPGNQRPQPQPPGGPNNQRPQPQPPGGPNNHQPQHRPPHSRPGEAFQPFGDGEITDCRKIHLKDLARLNRRDIPLRNNRFLQYGYYNFGHLLICRRADGRYILGVPGGYDQQERFMANMFGFPYFKESRYIQLPQGKGGYWYRLINTPDFH